jgi:hypothetical protein
MVLYWMSRLMLAGTDGMHDDVVEDLEFEHSSGEYFNLL